MSRMSEMGAAYQDYCNENYGLEDIPMTLIHQDWLRQHPMRIMCGGCKATGVKHAWTKDADYLPVSPYQPCPSCSGAGWAAPSPQEKADL